MYAIAVTNVNLSEKSLNSQKYKHMINIISVLILSVEFLY